MNADPDHRRAHDQRGGAAAAARSRSSRSPSVIVGLSAWGFDRLSHTRSLTSGETNLARSPGAHPVHVHVQLRRSALSASAIASPSISSEVESGVLMTIVTRPVRRTEVLLGKWLGLAAPARRLRRRRLRARVRRRRPGQRLRRRRTRCSSALYLFAEGALLLTLALLLSTRVPVIAAGVIGVAVFGAGWLAGVVGSLGTAFNIAALRTVGQVGRFLLPTDGLWHAAPSTTFSRPRSSLSTWPKAGGRSVLCAGRAILAVPAVGGLLVPRSSCARRGRELRASRAVTCARPGGFTGVAIRLRIKAVSRGALPATSGARRRAATHRRRRPRQS